MVAPEREPLKARVEVDEPLLVAKRPAARGSGPDRQGTRLELPLRLRGRGTGGCACRCSRTPSAYSLHAFLNDAVDAGTIVHTDGWRGYNTLTEAGFDHRPIKQQWRTEDRKEILPRAHRTIANLKTWLHGTHRSASAKHLQVYWTSSPFATTATVPMAAFQTLLGLGSLHGPTHLPPNHPSDRAT